MIKKINLTKGYVTIVDEVDYEYLMQWKWSAVVSKLANGVHVCAMRGYRKDGKSHSVLMHRSILERKIGRPIHDKLETDHINRDSLNNTRENLREVTKHQNMWNVSYSGGSSEYIGVSWQCRYKYWEAYVQAYGKKNHIGCFDNEIDAALARDEVARKLHGEFAVLNFPEVENYDGAIEKRRVKRSAS